MKKFHIYIVCFLLLSLALPSVAQNYYFKKYQVEEGMSYNTVLCAIQDSYGFMWFGTENGLNRYDGVRFTIFKNNFEDSTTIGDNYISSIFEDENRDLWIGTQKGIYIYERAKNSFVLFDKKTEYGVTVSANVAKIIETQTGQIWIATLGQGLFLYNKENDTLVQNSIHTSFVWDIAEDKRHRIYASSLQEGLVCFDQKGNHIESYNIQSLTKSEDMRIYCILPNDKDIWYSAGTNNIVCLNAYDKTSKQYTNKDQNMGVVRSIVPFSEQELLIGTNYGLYIFNIPNESFKRIDNPLAARSLSDLSVNNIYKDVEGGFWISTDIGGVNYLSQQTRIFEYYHPSYNMGLGTGRIINRFCQDENNNIWIATQSGLKYLDVKGNISSYNLQGIRNDYDIRSLLLDKNKLWVGTLGYGIAVVDLETNRVKEYKALRNTSRSIKSNDVLSLIRCKNGEIYVGTSWGLCKYVEATDDFDNLTNISTMVTISDMVEDDEGNLWIATQNSGAYNYNTHHGRLIHYVYDKDNPNSIMSNSIFCLFKDNNGRIWLGTNGGGLCFYSKEGNSFHTHAPSNGMLKDKAIYSIEEDNLGRFWIATSSGLACVDITGSHKTKLYTTENGIQSNQFTVNASLKSNTGKLYFGGTNGFNSFYPDELKNNTYVPPTYITGLRIHGKSGDGSSLKELTHLTTEISLAYSDNSFTIEYSALSYEEPNKNTYSYKLVGFDDRWIDNQNLSSTSYTNLSPGKYVFKVIGTNNDGISDEEGVSLVINIIPPWWRSTVAVFIYALLIGGLIYLLLRYWNNRTQTQAKQQIANFEKEKEKELYQSKINFFINLVHEIRTPLSLIKLPLDYLTEQKDDSKDDRSAKYLGIIDKNVKYLLNIVNQLLDFQKTENKSPKLDFREVDVNTITTELHDKFMNYAELKNINLLLTIPENGRMADVDQGVIEKISFNMIDNAIKYAKTKVEITLHYQENTFSISVADDGIGIEDSEKDKVFELFYQVDDRTNGGTGIGLAFSLLLAQSHNGSLIVQDSEWGGAQFVLTLPYSQENVAGGINDTNQVVGIVNNTDNEIKEKSAENTTILLVEDNEDLLQLTKEFLSPIFNVLTATNGAEALKVIKDEDIDVIVSDVMMPVMDGLELCKIIKTELNYSHIPVVLLTAKVTTEAKVEGMEYGADVYIEKPFSMRHLQMQIENLIKLRQAFQKQINSQTTPVVDSPTLSGKDKEFLKRLEVEIEKHLGESDFYIDSIAETMFMSRSSFYRKIKGITGTSPSEFLRTLRLNKAAEMLLEGSYNISEIYVFVGFSSSSYFAKCFKAQFGVLPKDYADEKRK